MLAAAIQAAGRGIIVGSQTSGAVAEKQVFWLPGGAALVVQTSRVLDPRGLALDGVGVIPDVVHPLVADDLDLQPRRKGVHHGNADAMQTARGLVNLRIEFAAGMQRAHDHFERRFFREFRMGIDRNAASVVNHGHEAIRVQIDIDERGVAGKRLIH